MNAVKNDLARLPVAPEFVGALVDQTVETLRAALAEIGAPEPVKSLVISLHELMHYLATYEKDYQEYTTQPAQDRFDIEGAVVEAVNALAACGTEFQGGNLSVPKREGTLLAEREE